MRATVFIAMLFGFFACVVQTFAQDSSVLLSRFQSVHDIKTKELTLVQITEKYPEAGPQLLKIASETEDVDTKWLAIRGLGILTFNNAVPLLIDSLSSPYVYVRSNAAGALARIKDPSAKGTLISLLKRENDGGVLEQTALAVQMVGANEALPILKAKMSQPSGQTRGWILAAIGGLGSREEIPFLATYLSDKDQYVAWVAARGIEQLTGQDFGFPRTTGPISFSEGIKNAQNWWAANRTNWKQ